MVDSILRDPIEQLQSEGYSDLKVEKKGGHKFAIGVCPSGHDYRARFQTVSKGCRCFECSLDRKRVSIEVVRKTLAEKGYELISDRYVNNRSKLSVRCDQHHLYETSFSSISQGSKCPYCARCKITEAEVRRQLESSGYKLLSEYCNNFTKLDLECQSGHRYKAVWSSFQQGTRCPYCAGKIITHEQVKRYALSRGFELLSDRYINSKTRLEFQCPQSHKFYLDWNTLHGGAGCVRCFHESRFTREDEIQRVIKKRVVKAIQQCLKRKKLLKPLGFSKNQFAKIVAYELRESLGEIPEGMEIDHIVPMSWFDLLDSNELSVCWSPQNLRYIPAIVNRRRSCYPKLTEVQQFTVEQLHVLSLASRKPKKWADYVSNLSKDCSTN